MDKRKEILKHFADDKFSFNDYLSASSYLKEADHSSEIKNYMEEEWDETGTTGSNNGQMARLLDSLHHQINLKRLPAYSGFYRAVSKIAVVLIVPALLTIAILSYYTIREQGAAGVYAEIYAPTGTRAKFQLPDGTEGWLNSGSSIKYPVDFRDRRVEVAGEAWFDVTPKTSSEFRVVTPYFDIKVLGTRFNVIAYENEETARVILEKGKVAIVDKNDKTRLELHPDQQIIYNKSKKTLMKSTIDSKAYTSWIDGLLIFKNEPMSEIVRRLGQKYNADIILKDEALKSLEFRATFQDESLDEICRMLSEVVPVEYEIFKREKQDDGSFKKAKIEIRQRN